MIACFHSQIHYFIIRPPGTVVPDGLMLYRRCFFSPRFLRDPSTDRPETLPHDQNLSENYKLTSKIRGALPPKKWGQKHAKFRSILYHFRLWSRICLERLKKPKIGKLMFPDRFLLRSMKKIWWTSIHYLQRSRYEFEPTKMHFLAYYISALRACCALKFLHALDIDRKILIGHIKNLS